MFSCACKPPKIDTQIRRVYSLKFDTCYCQFYELNNVEALTELETCEDFFFKNFPDLPTLPNIEYCDDLVGYSAKAWAKDITPWAKEVRRWGEDNCK